MIQEGKQVSIEYSVFTDKDKRIDSNEGKDPLIFLYGNKQILPALEQSLLGLKIGDLKNVTLDPEQAYGHVNPHAFKEVESNLIPEDLRFEGALLVVADEQFGEMLIRVDTLKEDKVVLDFNHPLSGKTLTFNVRILDIY